MTPISLPIQLQTHQSHNPANISLKQAATELEAAFLTEMLKSAGFGKSRETMGGGAGEDQFGSLLVRAQAEQIAQSGGIGLAETLFNALKESHSEK